MKRPDVCVLLLLLTAAWGCGGGETSLVNDPVVPTADAVPDRDADVPKGETYYAVFDTSEGGYIVAVHPGWAPLGAAHFRELIEAGFYDNCRFFRVIEGFMAQVGVNGDPAVHAQWHDKTIQDEPVKVSNKRGRVTFAKSGMPNSRSTQVFFSLADRNSFLDSMGFSPFGEVVQGMDIVEQLHSGYGDAAPEGRGPNQDLIRERGNEYLQTGYPELDYIETARVFATLDEANAALANPAAESGTTDAAAQEPAAPQETPAADAPVSETPAVEADATPSETP